MNPKKILLVDDEPDIRTIARFALCQVGGFHVVIATSGEEALAAAAREFPDLVLMDVMMPKMDGVRVARELQARGILPDVALIFLTAKAQTSEVEEYLSLGAAGVILKPFDPMTLAEEVQRIFRDHVAQRRIRTTNKNEERSA